MRRVTVLTLVLCICAGGMGLVGWAQEKEAKKKAKHTIKQVMKEAHGKKLLNKVVGGSATKEEKDKLLDLYISMIDNPPPKGEMQSWVMNSGRLIVAAARVSVGREGAEAELKTAANCKGCHQAHK